MLSTPLVGRLPRVRGVLRGLGATGGVLRVIRTRTGAADIAALVGLDFALTTVAAVSLAFFGDPNAWPAAIFFRAGWWIARLDGPGARYPPAPRRNHSSDSQLGHRDGNGRHPVRTRRGRRRLRPTEFLRAHLLTQG